MCVILVPTKRHPEPKELNDAQDSNPHGAGMAWKNKDGKLCYEKAIDAKRVYQIIEEENPKLPYIIHFRIASIGRVCDKLTHPFPVNQSVSLKKQSQGNVARLERGNNAILRS
jgi:predicted glutamine amidotransferase